MHQENVPEDYAHRLYTDLAPWWPLISPPEEYVDEIPRLRGALGKPGRLLELGSGGGHVASHLHDYDRTLVDLSESMLAVSRDLNPDCRHVCADMRSVRLGEQFDAVLVHDAIDYLIDPEDVERMLITAATHLDPGGVLVLAPDGIRDTFAPSTTSGGVDAPDGRGARFCEWVHEARDGENFVRVDYAFMLRHGDGYVEVVHDRHDCGLFSVSQWQQMLTDWDDVVIDSTEQAWGEGVLITARRSRQ
ncbi:MAG: class I SAM-dependent methyltransferase [Candidatus Nanopelagicales bacterium]